jgi:RNA polymerase sigma-70 factor, ECF subfamily
MEEVPLMMAGMTAATQRLDLERAFEDIVRTHQKRIYRVLCLLLGNPDEADSLTQECFLRAYAGRNGFRGDASLGTWLVRIAINLARDQQRNRRYVFWRRLLRGQDEASNLLADRRRTQEESFVTSERAKTVWNAVDCLPLKQRTAFILRFAEEMSIQEIADSMKLREGTVKAHLSAALRKVRSGMEQHGRQP